jgi:hypothetical protein
MYNISVRPVWRPRPTRSLLNRALWELADLA